MKLFLRGHLGLVVEVNTVSLLSPGNPDLHGVLEAEFTQKVVDFFKNKPNDYKLAADSKTASESQVRIRMESIAKGFVKSVINTTPSTPKLTMVKKVIPGNVSIYDNEDSGMNNSDIPSNIMGAMQGSY